MYEYHKMRPRELVERRAQLPVAYIGLGILEWHGLHNPLGLDGLKADGVARHLAAQLGGIVLPPLYWGEHRGSILETMGGNEAFADDNVRKHTRAIGEYMGIPEEEFLADADRSERNGGWELFEKLCAHILFQAETLGFRLIVAIPGHYPLFEPLTRAIRRYEEAGGRSAVFILSDDLFVEDGRAGDHAAAFETSLMMALSPDRVDLGQLDDDLSMPNIGVFGDDPRTGASAEFGRDILRQFAAIVREQIDKAGLGIPGTG